MPSDEASYYDLLRRSRAAATSPSQWRKAWRCDPLVLNRALADAVASYPGGGGSLPQLGSRLFPTRPLLAM